MRVVRIFGLAFALATTALTPAWATSITYSSYGFTGENVHIAYTSPQTALSEYGGAGPITLATTAGPLLAFCIDIFDWLQPSGTYIVAPPVISAADPTFLSDAAALIGNGLTGSAQAGAAVQVAIWDLEYNGILHPLSGPLTITPDDPALNSLVLADIGKLSSQWTAHGTVTELYGAPGNQSLITFTPGGGSTNALGNALDPQPVAEPASVVLLVTGLLALGFLHRRRQVR